MLKKLHRALKDEESVNLLKAIVMIIVMTIGLRGFEAAAASGYFGAGLCMAYALKMIFYAVKGIGPLEDEDNEN